MAELPQLKLPQSKTQREAQATQIEYPSTRMVAPPRYAKAVALKNATAQAVTVTATFGSDEQEAEGQAKLVETHTLAPHSELALGEHTYDMGSWTAIAALYSLEVQTEGQLGATRFTPSVDRIVNVLHVEIGAGDESLTLAAVKQA